MNQGWMILPSPPADEAEWKEGVVNSKTARNAAGYVCAALIALAVLTGPGGAEEYRIGAGDVLTVAYWQQPELNQAITVRQDGKITLAVIGEIQAAGLTTSRLEQQLVERMSRVNKNISQVVVTVTQFRSRSMFVGGEVNTPGMLYFEVIPDLWEVIKLAGGPRETADLSSVTVLRSADAGGGVVRVNLGEILAAGQLDRLPALHPGYTVTLGRLPAGLSPERFAEPSERLKVFYVYGNVASPGRHPIESDIDAIEALALSGGPGANADLENVRIISKESTQQVVRVVNLERYGKTGGPYRYVIKREDTIFVPTKKPGIFSGTWGAVRDLLAFGATASSIILLLNR